MMRPTSFFWLFIGLLSPFAAIAQHYYYVPNSPLIPAARELHDAGIGFGWSRNNGANGIEAQAYYSPFKQILVAANYMNIGEKEVLNNTLEGLKYRLYEVSAGVYEPLPRGSASLMAGYGYGNMFNAFRGEEFADLYLRRLFLQPAILYKDAFFQGGICLRLSHIKYTRGKVAVAIPAYDLAAIEAVEKKSPLFLPELGVTGAIRLQPVVIGVNMCGIFPHTDDLDFARVNSSIFLHVELQALWKKKKEPTPEG